MAALQSDIQQAVRGMPASQSVTLQQLDGLTGGAGAAPPSAARRRMQQAADESIAAMLALEPGERLA